MSEQQLKEVARAPEPFKIIDGPDELGFYTAYNEKSKYTHLKADQETPLSHTRYDDIEGFHEGFAVVHLDGKGFHIKPDGTPAYEKRYDGVVMRFEDGRAEVFAQGPKVILIKISDDEIHEQKL